jgi:hypothetical protein
MIHITKKCGTVLSWFSSLVNGPYSFLHCKKKLAVFPSPAGMSLPKSPGPEILNLLMTSLLRTGKPFLTVWLKELGNERYDMDWICWSGKQNLASYWLEEFVNSTSAYLCNHCPILLCKGLVRHQLQASQLSRDLSHYTLFLVHFYKYAIILSFSTVYLFFLGFSCLKSHILLLLLAYFLLVFCLSSS